MFLNSAVKTRKLSLVKHFQFFHLCIYCHQRTDLLMYALKLFKHCHGNGLLFVMVQLQTGVHSLVELHIALPFCCLLPPVYAFLKAFPELPVSNFSKQEPVYWLRIKYYLKRASNRAAEQNSTQNVYCYPVPRLVHEFQLALSISVLGCTP